jgi:hypothetical protein
MEDARKLKLCFTCRLMYDARFDKGVRFTNVNKGTTISIGDVLPEDCDNLDPKKRSMLLLARPFIDTGCGIGIGEKCLDAFDMESFQHPLSIYKILFCTTINT